ncbi:THAP domain-containing protein 7 isoform X4 [Ammospiza nelsoni]|uniref:THAP domain-containing protein 7 isoform X2 n=1 Tax=Ammospiza caudacuta TaxID=2857398 RepID=UPI0027386B50|nr:THAP domain-containing protein 7 isoform X2 [Ammospiza caudacuta]XP_059347326.1 THAP domain-containing protein 7 isoform X4 [Ammospiza nelsoni]
MPRHCSAAGCCTRDTRDTRGRGISFHRLPRRDDPRRAQWLENSRRRDPAGGGRWDPSSKYIYFCSQHFESSCFELVGYSGYHRLKEGAVPTVFAPGPSRPPRPPKPPPERDPPRPPRGARRWRRDLPPAPPPPPVPSDVSCFPRDSKDPGPPPAGDHGGVPALPGPSGSIPETLLAATGDAAAAATPALPEGAPPTPAGPPAPPAPPSPSLFMLRLPPRAGSYIQSEHSYQVGSALLWKRRAEAALDALDKAQRQLQAGKRREHRLRLRLAELQRERRAGPEPRRSSKERLEVIGDGGGGVGGL